MNLTDHRILTKKAITDYEIHNLLAERYSPRAFDRTPINDDVLNRLFEAMRWAPSSMNAQPWRVIYSKQGEEAHMKIAETLMPGNRPWAEKAPVLLLALIKSTFEHGAPNSSASYDLGLAIGNLTVQATHEQIGLHQMGGFSPEKARELFQIPDGYEAVTAIALGYYGDPDELPEGLRERELAKRSRKPVAEIAFHNEFKS